MASRTEYKRSTRWKGGRVPSSPRARAMLVMPPPCMRCDLNRPSTPSGRSGAALSPTGPLGEEGCWLVRNVPRRHGLEPTRGIPTATRAASRMCRTGSLSESCRSIRQEPAGSIPCAAGAASRRRTRSRRRNRKPRPHPHPHPSGPSPSGPSRSRSPSPHPRPHRASATDVRWQCLGISEINRCSAPGLASGSKDSCAGRSML